MMLAGLFLGAMLLALIFKYQSWSEVEFAKTEEKFITCGFCEDGICEEFRLTNSACNEWHRKKAGY